MRRILPCSALLQVAVASGHVGWDGIVSEKATRLCYARQRQCIVRLCRRISRPVG